MYDVLVIGGGPAGMMAAISAARNGRTVGLVEKNDRLGAKIMASGNGRCNITNKFANISHYHGSVVALFQDIYDQFDVKNTIDYFQKIGVDLKEEDLGRMFPVSDRAITVLTALTKELKSLKVDLFTGTTVRDLRKAENWEVVLDQKVLTSKTVILTTGGKAAHRLGSSGDGLFWSLKLGHTPTPIYAALVPMETEETFVTEVMGVKLSVRATALVNNKVKRQYTGEMLFTHYGVSGPAVMGLAGALAPYVGIKTAEIRLNMLPDSRPEEIKHWLNNEIEHNPKKKLATILDSRVPRKVALLLSKLLSLDNKNVSEISKTDRVKTVDYLTAFPLTIKKIRPLRDAQVTSGGISVDEVTENLESKVNPGLFFAGEILDIDGDSGGFNLQWAWSSGVCAGAAAANLTK